MSITDEAILKAMGVAHHAYCRDTGCFDGCRIDHPETELALKRVALAARFEALTEAQTETERDETWVAWYDRWFTPTLESAEAAYAEGR